MPNIVLDRRTLNRALLDRQLLLERSEMSALDAIEHLVGMQSQAPDAPYVGLWTRLKRFSFAELAGLMTERRAVRIVLMRGTVHLVSASDALALRPVVQPMLDRQFRSSAWARGMRGVDREELVAAGRALVGERARNPAELRAALGERWPEADPG
ncbi:winged helix DNA-binding domain-containing protein, partial [Streptomyces sp. 110]